MYKFLVCLCGNKEQAFRPSNNQQYRRIVFLKEGNKLQLSTFGIKMRENFS